MKLPKVTYSLKEFQKREGVQLRPINDRISGLCGDETIWIKTGSPVTLLHELVHYFIRRLHLKAIKFKSASVVLFLDFLGDGHDFINRILRHRKWRGRVHEALDVVVESWNDWLDWVLCREP